MKRLGVIVFALVLSMMSGVGVCAQSVADSGDSKPFFTLITPRAGELLRGGQQIEIKWDVGLDSVILQNPYGEMELILDLGSGQIVRVTPQLNLNTRTFLWTVPNLNVRNARLGMKAGIEGEGDPYSLFQAGSFNIKSVRGGPVIELDRLPEKVGAGNQVELTWSASNFSPGGEFDVMVSYDRGAHYQKAGTTVEPRFSLPVQDDFAGSITIQIVGRVGSVVKVRSIVTGDSVLRIGKELEDRDDH